MMLELFLDDIVILRHNLGDMVIPDSAMIMILLADECFDMVMLSEKKIMISRETW